MERGFRVRGLGEVAIRCGDLGAMTRFYEEVLGLERLEGGASGGIVFYRIAEGVAGHTTVLALFGPGAGARPGLHPDWEGAPETGARSSLHHVALSLTRADQDAVIAWYDRIGQPYRIEVFGWIGWRGVFTQDPEGNTIELVAHDDAFLDQAPEPGP